MTDNLEALRQAAIDRARVLEKQNVRVKITTKTLKHDGKSAAAGIEIYEDIEYVEIFIIGDAANTVSKALKYLSDQQRKDYEPLIAYFRASREHVPQTGTPLKMTPWLSPAQVATYEASGVLTLENLATLSDANIAKFGMGARDHARKAQAHLTAAKDASEVNRLVDMETRLRAENDDLRRQMVELKKALDAVTEEIVEEPPRKRLRIS